MHLRRDIIRSLISHTGAILQNKLTNHRPSNKAAKNKKNLTVLYGTQNGGSGSSIRDAPHSASSIFKFGKRADTLHPPTEHSDPGTPTSTRSAFSIYENDGDSTKSSSSASALTAPASLGRATTAESELTGGSGDAASIITAHNTATGGRFQNSSAGRHLSSFAATARGARDKMSGVSPGVAGQVEFGPSVGLGEEVRPGSAGTATTAVKGSKRDMLKKKVFGGL